MVTKRSKMAAGGFLFLCVFIWAGNGFCVTTGTSAISGTIYQTEEWWVAPSISGDGIAAKSIGVTAGQTLPAGNFQLETAVATSGSVSGRVTGPDGQPIEGLSVQAHSSSCVFPNPLGQGTTDASGNYAIYGLPPGSVYIRVCAECTGRSYISELWNGPSGGGTTNCSTASPVDVSVGADTPGIDFQLTLGALISGTLFGSGGVTPITGVSIVITPMVYEEAYGAWYSTGSWAMSDPSNGTYTIYGILPGTYYLRTWHEQANYIDEWYAFPLSVRDVSQADSVTVTAGDVLEGKDFQLEPGAAISGRVYQSDGTPITNTTIVVSVFSDNPCSHSSGEWGMENQMINVSDGTYSISGLTPGTYFMKADALSTANYVMEWSSSGGSTPDCAQAEPIEVAEGQTITSKDFWLDTGATVSGRIYRSDGITPLTGQSIGVSVISELCGGWQQSVAEGWSDSSDGSYTIFGIPSGTFYLKTSHYLSGYVNEWWSSSGSVLDCSQAESFSVAAEGSVVDKDFQLDPAGSVSGVVTDASNGQPIVGMHIQAFSGICFQSFLGEAVAHDDGSYTISRLPTGNVYVRACPECAQQEFIGEFWDGPTGGGAIDCSLASPVAVTAGTVSPNVNFSLEPGQADSDEDGLSDMDEMTRTTDPFNWDTDGDRVSDGQEVMDGTDPKNPASYLPSSAEVAPLAISPEARALLRETVDGIPQTRYFSFEVSGGVPFEGTVRHYRVKVLSDRLTMPETGYADEEEDGVFRYWFSTQGKEDGYYIIEAEDLRGDEAISKPVFLYTLSLNEVAAGWWDAGSACNLSISGTETAYDGSSVVVAAQGNPGGMELTFSIVSSGYPFVSRDELLAEVIRLEAIDAEGNPVSLGSPATVTISYAAMVGGNDPLDLAVIHLNENTGRWERVTPLGIDLVGKTLSFSTGDFSLFGVVIPSEHRFSILGGSAQSDFYMISIPGQALGNNLGDHLEEGFLGTYDDTQWRLFAYDPVAQEYVEATSVNRTRFSQEFGLRPGIGFWLISRTNAEPFIPVLSFNEEVGSVFHAILAPGWNMVSHPWAGPVDHYSHDIEVSPDGMGWLRIDSAANISTEGSFWRFLRHEGSESNWYEKMAIAGAAVDPDLPPGPPPSPEQSALLAGQSYWIKNLEDHPVALRMKKTGTTGSLVEAVELPGKLRMLAVRWIEKTLSGDRTCIAQSAGDQPPDPPAVDSGRRTIGVASGGGGGCFIQTASESLAGKGGSALPSSSRKSASVPILLACFLLILSGFLVCRTGRGE